MEREQNTYTVRKQTSARELPAEWDTLATLYFQKRSFLEHNERYNHCSQRYYLAFGNDGIKAAAIVYTIPIDLLTFSNIHSPVRMQVIGIPASVSAPGIIGSKQAMEFLISYLLEKERGFILGLNLSPHINTGRGIAMVMLPTIELPHSFDTWDDYLEQLRSPYRRRCMQITDKWKDIDTVQSSCGSFTTRHHELYLKVLKHSTTRLETLSKDYFENLPENFSLTTYYKNGEMLCWHINCRDETENKLYFFFGGHDYRFNNSNDAYFNNLLGVLKEGIDEGFSAIDFGQTAEIPKLKLGGETVPKNMFIYHRNPILLFFLKMGKRSLGYRKVLPHTHVFRKGFQPETKRILS